jgi:hypothetical protein
MFGRGKADLKDYGHYNGTGEFKESELRFALLNLCPCGARLAYPKGASRDGYWDCADILMGKAIPSGQEGSVQHTAALPFVFYEIKGE